MALMRPFETLETTITPEGLPLTLHHRDGDYFINLDGDELMATRAPRSEKALAELGCAHLLGDPSKYGPRGPKVLIGGLGLGFTLRATLDLMPRRAEVVVAELFPSVVAWNRSHLAHLHGNALDDRRVKIDQRDVVTVIRDGCKQPYDAMLLDVDNGPTAWCLASNSRLYDRHGLAQMARALAPGGQVAYWSAQPDSAFRERLRKSGFVARSVTVRSRGEKGSRNAIFVAHVANPFELRKLRKPQRKNERPKGPSRKRRR